MELEIVIVDGDGSRHDARVSWGPDHRVADLAAALGNHLGSAFPALHVVGPRVSRLLDPESLVAEAALGRGSVLRARGGKPPWSGRLLAVVGGPDVGRVCSLEGRDVVVGRGTDADLRVEDAFVSRRHCRLVWMSGEALAEDLGSSNGTVLGGAVLEGTFPGGVPLAGRVEVGHQSLGLGSTLLRVLDGAPMRDLVVEAHGRVRLEPTLAAVPDTSPVVRAPQPGDGAAASPQLRADVASALHARHPDMATLRLAARAADAPLWSRGGPPGELRVGWGPVTVQAADGSHVPVADAPIHVDLADGLLHLEGDGDVVGRAAAALVLRAALLHAPTEFEVHVLAASTSGDRWRWVHWLPHAAGAGLVLGAGAATARVRDLLEGPARDRPSLVVVEGGAAGTDDLISRLAASGRARVVAVGGSTPAGAASAVEVQPGGALVVRTTKGALGGMGVDGVGSDVATELALSLAALTVSGLPSRLLDRPDLRELLPAIGHEAIRAAWQAGRPRRAPIGVGEQGVVALPLDQGPVHVQVTGQQSTARPVIEAIVLGMATGVGPERLAMAFGDRVDDRLRRLPHVMPGAAASVADDVALEIQRRSESLRLAGLTDWDELRRADPAAPPRLLAVVDEADVLSRPGSDGMGEAGRCGVDLVTVGNGPGTTAVRLVVVGDGTATLLTESGQTPLRVAVLVAPDGGDDRLEVVTLDASGRPTTLGQTSLARTPVAVDPLQRIVGECLESARELDPPSWSAAPDPRAVHRVRRTFVFTDIVGSTRLVEVIGDAAWADLVGWHDRVLRELFAQHQGLEVDHAGDGFLVSFDRASDAVRCAVAIQRHLDAHRASAGFAPRVRVGGHTADVVEADGFKGHGLHVAARVGSLGDADEIVFSALTLHEAATESPDEVPPRVVQARAVAVKGAAEPIDVRWLDWR